MPRFIKSTRRMEINYRICLGIDPAALEVSLHHLPSASVLRINLPPPLLYPLQDSPLDLSPISHPQRYPIPSALLAVLEFVLTQIVLAVQKIVFEQMLVVAAYSISSEHSMSPS